MKKLRLFTMLSALALAAAGALGLTSIKEGKKAKTALADSYSGSVIIKKNDKDMKWTGSKIVGYLFNGSSNTWGTAIANDGNTYQEYSWSGLSFNPTTIIIMRVASDWTPGWTNYCRTGNITLSSTDVIWMHGDAKEDNSNNHWGTFQLDAVVKGGASDDWSVQTINAQLSNVKVSSGGSSIEAYGEVNLPANSYFKVVKEGSNWCGGYSAHSLISSNLENSTNGNIHNVAAAKYEFYFDYDACTTYITDPAHSAADEWAQYFLGHVGCDSTGTNSPSGWSACATEYAKLSGDAKDLVYGAIAKEDGSYIEQAVARYDQALRSHPSLTKFIVSSSSQVRGANVAISPLSTISNNSNMVIAIVVISLVSVTVIGGYFFIKKRKSI